MPKVKNTSNVNIQEGREVYYAGLERETTSQPYNAALTVTAAYPPVRSRIHYSGRLNAGDTLIVPWTDRKVVISLAGDGPGSARMGDGPAVSLANASVYVSESGGAYLNEIGAIAAIDCGLDVVVEYAD